MRNLIDILDFSTEEIDKLVEVASDIMESPEKYADAAKGKTDKGAMQEIEEQFGFPVYSIVDVYDIIEYLEEDEKNRENVERIKNYLAVNGAKA